MNMDHFSDLPVELKKAIISFLDRPQVVNFRLMSKHFAILGREGLSRGCLTLRIHCDDMHRLTEISELPWLAASIREIEIFTGDFDIHQILRYFAGDRDKEQTNHLVDIINCIRRNRYSFCDEQTLATAFLNLEIVTSIAMTSTKFPFRGQSHYLVPTWKRILRATKEEDLDSHVYRDLVTRYTTVALATRVFHPPLTKVVMKSFPIEGLNQASMESADGTETSMLSEMINLCKQVEHLQIGFRTFGEEIYHGPNGKISWFLAAGSGLGVVFRLDKIYYYRLH